MPLSRLYSTSHHKEWIVLNKFQKKQTNHCDMGLLVEYWLWQMNQTILQVNHIITLKGLGNKGADLSKWCNFLCDKGMFKT